MLEIRKLIATIEDKTILQGVNLKIPQGEVHVIMGPNGSGKSTLANVIAGHPRYQVTSGEIMLNGKSVLSMSPEERAFHGMFMAFQYPREITGVQLDRFLFTAYKNIHAKRFASRKALTVFQFKKRIKEEMAFLKMKSELSDRGINAGFSGGEKKKAEMLQMILLDPSLIILDETDSGLDIDALKVVGEAVNRMKNSERSFLIVTHYQRLLKYIHPDVVHVMINGTIVKSGGSELIEKLEKEGYQSFT